jgi:hypothetical protein
MRNKIFGTIGIIWGGGIVLSWLFSPGSSGGSEAYQAGQSGAVIFGVIMLALGIYYVAIKPKTDAPATYDKESS